MKANPTGTAKLATNKEVVVHLVRQSGRGKPSEDRSARFQPTKIKVSGMRKRKVATKYMPATRIRLCAYSVTVETRPFRSLRDSERNGDITPTGERAVGQIALRCCLQEDCLVASGGVRLEPRHSPKRAAVRKIGKWRDISTLRF